MTNRVGEDITFAQLRTFVCAANAGSFVNAADRLGISQPAVSEQITNLERRLGQTLFLRRRGTTPLLTARGQAALQTVETILAASADLFAPEPANLRKIDVRIVIGPLLREKYLNPLLSAICREHPEVELKFLPTRPLPEGIRALEQGELDLLAYTVYDFPEERPCLTRVCEVPVVMVARPGMQGRLDRGECCLEDLDFLFPTERTAYSERWVRQLLRGFGLKLERSVKFLDCGEALTDLVQDGQGVAYMMMETVAEQVASGKLEVLDIPLSPMQRIIARGPSTPPVVASISAMLHAALRTHTPRRNGRIRKFPVENSSVAA